MPRPQWTVEQCRLYGRKGGSHRKGKKVRTEEYIAGFSAGYKAGRAERKRAGMTENTENQNECSLGNTASGVSSDPPSTPKHRALCAAKLVWADGVSCGLPCDCDNPQPWVAIPTSDEGDEGAQP